MGVRRGSARFRCGRVGAAGVGDDGRIARRRCRGLRQVRRRERLRRRRGDAGGPLRHAEELIDSLAPGQTGCFRAGTYTFSQTDVNQPGITLAPYGDEAVTLKGAIKVKPAGHDSTIEGMKLNGAGGTTRSARRSTPTASLLRDNEITNDHTSICVHVGS